MSGLGFTGTREGLTPEQKVTLEKALFHYSKIFTIMHNGDCKGADEYAGLFWLHCKGKLWLHPPTIQTHRAHLKAAINSEPQPFLRRNMEIVLASDTLIACPKEDTEILRSGTWATIRYAKDNGKPFFIIYPNGTVEGTKHGFS